MSRPKKKKAVKAAKIVTAKETAKPRGLAVGAGLLEGMKDILPREQKYWQLIRQRVEQLARDYGFERIDLPLLEKLALFEKGLGKQSELLTKEIFSFTDRDGANVALRPTATFSIARAYLEHKLNNLPQPVKLYYCGPMFRYEQWRSGNQRQFYQFGFEVLGSAQPVIDAQLILIAFNFYKDLAVPVMVQINSIGCSLCQSEYVKVLSEHYRQKKNLLCQSCKENFAKNPFKIFNCQQDKCQELREEAPQLIDHLCEECKNHFIKVLEYLDELELPYILSPFLVKEVAYGTRTVFEICPEETESKQPPLAGGGRYDNLVEILGGEPTPACGFAVGLERTILKIKEENLPVSSREDYDVFIAQLGEPARRKALLLFEDLKEKGIKVAESFSQNGLKLQLELAAKLAVKFALILGQKEVLDNTIMIRDLEGGTQEVIDFNKVALEIQKRLKKE